jgi:hypothetical protein
MARTYGHPEPSRTSQPSQHRNTLRVQDALRAISKGDRGVITKDDFLDFLASFPRLYRCTGVIGERLTVWIQEHQDEVDSWQPEIEQMQPGFFRSEAEDEADGVVLMAAGEYVTRTQRGLPESYTDDGASAKKPRARRDLDLGDSGARMKREPRGWLQNDRKTGSGFGFPGQEEEGRFGTPLERHVTAKYPKFAGMSTEELLLRTAQAAQKDFEVVRSWFRAQRKVLDPSDPLVPKFKRLENELPKYDAFVGVAEEIEKVTKSREQAAKMKRPTANGDDSGSRRRGVVNVGTPLATPDHSTRSATANGAGDADDEDDSVDGSPAAEEGTPSKGATVTKRGRKLRNTESSNSLGVVEGRRQGRKRLAAQSKDAVDPVVVKRSPSGSQPVEVSASELSDPGTEPSMQSKTSSRRAASSSASASGSQVRGGSTEDMEWEAELAAVDGADDPEDDNYRPRPGSKRKRKRTKKALESGELDVDQ